ncbi:MAG: hypothetical protein JNG86_19550, partial [Verrucomicrobiaceae bacterium]|nr:hypothetical protein [Verrucomicrobiaceae bacterium]
MPQAPSTRRKSSRSLNSLIKLAAMSLTLAAAVVATGYYIWLMVRGPEKQGTAQSSIVGASPAVQTTQPKPPSVPQTTLNRIAQAENARQNKPTGPLYDVRSRDVELSYQAIELDAPQVQEALELLKKYQQAATWRERLPLVFEPERCEPLLLEHYDKRGAVDPENGKLIASGIITAGSSQVLNLRFACAARPDSGMRANFHRKRNGQLLLDWESWVAWSEKTWPALKKERLPLPAVMRAVASESSYYNYEFGEDWRWLAVKLRSPDGLHSVTGYVPRSSVLAVALGNLIGVPVPAGIKEGTPIPALRPSGSKALVTVRVAFPQNAQSDHCV